MASDPSLGGRGHPPADESRAIIFAPDANTAKWIDEELAGQKIALQTARSINEVVAALVEDPPPRPQILIADFDAMAPAEVLHLHVVRNQGWFGSIIALGTVSDELRASLNMDRVLIRPLGGDVLRKAVADVGLSLPTMRMKALDL